MQNLFSHEEIQTLLKSLNLKRYNFIDPKDSALLAKALKGLPDEAINGVVSGAFFYAEITKQNINALTLNKIIHIIESIDYRTLEDINSVIENLRDSGMDEQTIQKVSKQINSYVLSLLEPENKNLVNSSSMFLASASKVSSIFSDMTKDLKKSLVSEIYANCTTRMKTFWQKVDANNFKDVIFTLTSELQGDNFTEKELIDLSNKCATIFSDSSRDKILGLEGVLSEYKDFCLNLIENSQELKSSQMLKLKDFKISQILRTTSSIAKANTRTLYHTSKFLQGNSIGDVFAHKIENDEANSQLYKKYGDVKIDLSIDDMVWVLTKNPSLFSTSLTKTLSFLDKLESGIKNSYAEKSENFDIKSLITRENFLKGIPTNVDAESINKNIELLSCFMSPSELQHYLKSDMNIFNIESEKLQELVVDVFVNGNSSSEIYNSLTDILKCKINNEIKSYSADKRKNKKDKQVQPNQTENVSINVKFNFEEIKDFAFDFDLKKLKILLGKHYEKFEKSLNTSGVDSEKLRGIISKNENVEHNSDNKSVSLDVDKLQQSAHSGYYYAKNKIEALWQMHRNIQSAINLIELMKAKGELNEEKVYILSSNYFKLAGEKNQVFDHLDEIDENYRSTASYLRGKVERYFDELTQKYSECMIDNSDYVKLTIDKLSKQIQTIDKQMQRFSFINIDEESEMNLYQTRKELMEKITATKQNYELNQGELIESKALIRTKKFEIENERNNPTVEPINPTNVRPFSLFDFIYVSKKEEELHKELELMLEKHVNIEVRAGMIIKELDELQKRLDLIDEKLKSSAIYMGLSQRLKELNSRLYYALKVHGNINEQSEK